MRVRESVCVRERKREKVCVCVRVRDRERDLVGLGAEECPHDGGVPLLAERVAH